MNVYDEEIVECREEIKKIEKRIEELRGMAVNMPEYSWQENISQDGFRVRGGDLEPKKPYTGIASNDEKKDSINKLIIKLEQEKKELEIRLRTLLDNKVISQSRREETMKNQQQGDRDLAFKTAQERYQKLSIFKRAIHRLTGKKPNWNRLYNDETITEEDFYNQSYLNKGR